MTTRRAFIVGSAAVLVSAPVRIDAQQRNIPRVGVISAITREAQGPWSESFHEGLRNLGYVDGQNIALEWRYADGRAERFQELADELVQLKVDIILAANQPGVQAAQKATTTIPIVMVLLAQDPIRGGFVRSLPRPGGNITGFWAQSSELAAKRLQLLHEVVPNVSRVALLWDPGFVGIHDQVRETQAAAKALGMELQLVEASSPAEFDSGFAAMMRQGTRAIVVIGSSMHFVYWARIAELALKSRLPSSCFLREFAEAGCLMSYAPSIRDLWRRSATYVDRILKGAKPADLPVEQPTKFELVINLKTAKALGLTIPPSLLLRADQVLE
jgi:putative ABC transport system substrate-binding protein